MRLQAPQPISETMNTQPGEFMELGLFFMFLILVGFMGYKFAKR